jgi:PAS domain S-box-containing protein
MVVDTSGFFKTCFENARNNSMMVLSEEGIVLQVNKAFTTNFGYENADIVGQNFALLFTAEDQAKQLPNSELEATKTQGSSQDNNFLVHQSKVSTWVSGESFLVNTPEGENYIVKIIHEIHAQKLLEKFLMEANEFINAIFTSIHNAALVVMDNSMRIVRANDTFFSTFNIKEQHVEGTRVSDIDHPLWSSSPFQQTLREKMVKNDFQHGTVFTKDAGGKTYRVQGKLIDGKVGIDTRILLVINEQK